MNKGINRAILNRTFPFFFTIDKSLIIRDAGSSLLKMNSQIIQKSFFSVFEIKRPFSKKYTYTEFKNNSNKLFLLKFINDKCDLQYKAQVVVMEEDRRLTFVGTPIFKDVEEILENNLSLNDFAISDSSIDVLQMLQINKLVNEDMQELNRRLKLKEIKYRNLIENANEIIFTTDINGKFTFMNDVGLRFVGLNETSLLDHYFHDLMDSEYSKIIENGGKDLLSNNEKVVYVEFPLKNKPDFWIGQNITVISDDKGKFGFQGIGRNISEKREYEKIILKEKLKAEQAAKEKSRFLANMSHEIRTPINGVVGLTNLLLETELTSKQKKYLEAIVSSSETLMVVINDILDLSKMDAGKLTFANKPFKIKTTLLQVIEMMDSKAIHKGLELNYSEKNNLPKYLFGDEARLNQIMYNLIGNAIKFTDKGFVSVDVETQFDTENQCYLLVTISDSGIGITPEKLKNIFGAFSQVEENDSRKYQGTGLGLTISKRLIELQGGELTVKSTFGKGSVFSVKLPFIFSNENQSENKDTKQLKSISNFFPGLQILLAEDNPINQMVTIDLLSNKGAKIDLAENGQIALDMLEKKEYDIVLMDMQMPVLDGYKAMQEVRKNEKLKHNKIIALTAHVNETEMKKCYNAGADDYLSKPFKPMELFNKIYSLCNNEEIQEKQSEYDFSKLYQLTANNDALVKQMLETIKSESQKDIEIIISSHQKGDLNLSQKTFDNLKSTLTYIENNDLIITLGKLQESLKTNSGIESSFASIKKHLNALTKSIDIELSLL